MATLHKGDNDIILIIIITTTVTTFTAPLPGSSRRKACQKMAKENDLYNTTSTHVLSTAPIIPDRRHEGLKLVYIYCNAESSNTHMVRTTLGGQ